MVHKVDVAVSENKMTSGSGDITKLSMDEMLSADIVRLADRSIVIGSEEFPGILERTIRKSSEIAAYLLRNWLACFREDCHLKSGSSMYCASSSIERSDLEARSSINGSDEVDGQ